MRVNLKRMMMMQEEEGVQKESEGRHGWIMCVRNEQEEGKVRTNGQGTHTHTQRQARSEKESKWVQRQQKRSANLART